MAFTAICFIHGTDLGRAVRDEKGRAFEKSGQKRFEEFLEIESHAQPNLPLPISPGRHNEVSLCSRIRNSEAVIVDKSRAVAEDGGVKDIIKLCNRPESHAFTQFELSRHT